MYVEEQISTLQQLEPECEKLVARIKAAKHQQCKTIQQLADETGIPKATLSRFLPVR